MPRRNGKGENPGKFAPEGPLREYLERPYNAGAFEFIDKPVVRTETVSQSVNPTRCSNPICRNWLTEGSRKRGRCSECNEQINAR